MVSSTIPLIGPLSIVLVPVFATLFFYVTYRAFIIRRALVVRLYRNQALWVGVTGIYWGIFTMGSFLIPAILAQNPATVSPNFIIAYVSDAALYFALILSFLWIDVTVRVARRSDPLLRDTLRWSKLRILLWAVILIGMTIGLVYLAPPIVAASNGNPLIEIILFYVANLPVFLVVGVTSLAALLLSGRRTQDIILRRQLRALLVYVFVLVFQGLSSFIYANIGSSETGQIVTSVVGVLVFFANSYSLFRTARSLAPTSRIRSLND